MTGPHDRSASGPEGTAQGSSRAGDRRVGLKRRAEFVAVARGRRVNAATMTLQVYRRPDDLAPEARFGLTVTKKVGDAVERNRIKRRFRQVLRASAIAPQPGHDYVIVARREALTCAFGQLVTDLARLIDQSRHRRSRPRDSATGMSF